MNYTTIRIFFDGMLVMMLLYTLITFMWQRKKVLAYYSLYIISVLCYLDINDHRFFFDLYNRFPGLDIGVYNFSVGTIEVICFNLYAWFAIQFMDLRKNDRLAYQLINAIAILLVFSVFIHFLHTFTSSLNENFYVVYRSSNRYLLSGLSIAVIIRIMRLRNQIVTFFILGTFFYVAGTLASVVMIQTGMDIRQQDLLYTFPLLPTQVGMILEAICFTIGFTVLNRRTELEKLQFQQQLVEQLLENERKQQKLQLIRDDIARDLHDEIGSDLSAMTIMSEVGARQVEDLPHEAKTTFKTISKLSRQVLSTMREIVWSLNSSQDSVESMSLRMRETASAMFEYTSVKVHIQTPDFNEMTIVEPHHRRDLLLIFKEILHNIIKHASAANVFISLTLEENEVTLKVKDDGVGFNFTGNTFPGNGLKNLHQRSHKLNGDLKILAEPGQGTTITVSCPVYKMELQEISA